MEDINTEINIEWFVVIGVTEAASVTNSRDKTGIQRDGAMFYFVCFFVVFLFIS